MSVATVAFVVLTVLLGNWQGRRAEEKLELARRLDDAQRSALLSIPPARVDPAGFEQRRVSARGRYVARATIFLDNKVLNGRAGYHVLTPLKIEGGDMHVLVDRGWIASGDRRELPPVRTPDELQLVEGVAVVPSGRFIELAPEAGAGPLRQNLVIAREEKRLGLVLQPLVIEQTSDAQDGLARVRQAPDSGVAMHQSYAMQWYSLALLAVVLYVVLNLKRIDAGDGPD